MAGFLGYAVLRSLYVLLALAAIWGSLLWGPWLSLPLAVAMLRALASRRLTPSPLAAQPYSSSGTRTIDPAHCPALCSAGMDPALLATLRVHNPWLDRPGNQQALLAASLPHPFVE